MSLWATSLAIYLNTAMRICRYPQLTAPFDYQHQTAHEDDDAGGLHKTLTCESIVTSRLDDIKANWP